MDAKDIKDIIELVGRMGIANLELEKGDTKLRISCSTAANTATSISTFRDENSVAEEILDSKPRFSIKDDATVVKSPMLGTFYATPSPDAKPYVEPGSKVKTGDTLCIIEAMKVMNEITSEYDGEIVEILVNNGELVEYGQPLMLIRK